jgi:hypothetical protein
VVPSSCGGIEFSGWRRPHWTEAAFARSPDVVPLMYFADDYDAPTEFRFPIDPRGYDAQDYGIELVSATIRPLRGHELDSLPQRLGEEQAPFRKGNDPLHRGYAFYPVGVRSAEDVGPPDLVDALGRYALFEWADTRGSSAIGYNPHEYFLTLGKAVDRERILPTFSTLRPDGRTKFRGEKPAGATTFADEVIADIPRIIPLRLAEDGRVEILPDETGWLISYTPESRRLQSLWQGDEVVLQIGERQLTLSDEDRPNTPMYVGLHDRDTGLYYYVEEFSFGTETTDRE